ncbi:MAG: SpoIIIAH-like family protein [Clostridia bacterium]|nr:SpoIIIAH-like family protein [Clostridia bacterium]
MKKGKVLTKGQITVAVMLIALGGAIWLNAKFLPSGTKYLGETSYVSKTEDKDAVQTAAKTETKEDYFSKSANDRKKAREEAVETVEELLDTDKLTDADKKTALQKIELIAKRIEAESNIETLLKAKGFENALAVISDSGVSIVVKSQGLTSAQTMQIQEIATEQSGVSLDKIKIIPIA